MAARHCCRGCVGDGRAQPFRSERTIVDVCTMTHIVCWYLDGEPWEDGGGPRRPHDADPPGPGAQKGQCLIYNETNSLRTPSWSRPIDPKHSTHSRHAATPARTSCPGPQTTREQSHARTGPASVGLAPHMATACPSMRPHSPSHRASVRQACAEDACGRVSCAMR